MIVEIPETARGGVIRTHIMCKAKLSYAQTNEYLPLLLDKGYLETHAIPKKRGRTQTVLKTSQRGEEFKGSFRNLEL